MPPPDHPLVSWSGVAEATLTILVTSLEDCVWLVPLIARPSNRTVAWTNGAAFVIASTGMSLLTCLLAVLLDAQFGTGTNLLGLQMLGAALCWILAAFYFYKSRRKRQGRLSTTMNYDESLFTNEYETCPVHELHDLTNTSTTALPIVERTLDNDDNNDDETRDTRQHDTAQPWMILSFTILGGLDEVAYFPALILGKVFTWAELVLASLLTSLIVLLCVDVLVKRCNVCLRVLDRIPLYAVVAMYAFLLTVEIIWDFVTDDNN
jgi:hypothetical protein